MSKRWGILRSEADVNFVGLDWGGGAQTIDYPRACANCQIAGRAIAYFFNELRKDGFQGMLHCGGHSLGAHVCAYAGKYTQSKGSYTEINIKSMRNF